MPLLRSKSKSLFVLFEFEFANSSYLIWHKINLTVVVDVDNPVLSEQTCTVIIQFYIAYENVVKLVNRRLYHKITFVEFF